MKFETLKSGIVSCALLLTATPSTVSYGQNLGTPTKKGPSRDYKNQNSAGARLGLVSVTGLDSRMLGYGIFFERSLQESVSVGTTLDFWNMSTGGLGDSQWSMNDLGLGVNGKFHFAPNTNSIKPFVSAGLSGHRVSLTRSERSDIDSTLQKYQSKNNDVSAQIALDIGAGLVYSTLDQLDLNALVLYRQFAAAGSNLNQLGISGGVGYRM